MLDDTIYYLNRWNNLQRTKQLRRLESTQKGKNIT